MLVVLVAANLVGGLGAELDHVEGVEAHFRVGDRGGDRLLVAGGHVDRDRPDRLLLLVGQPVEERLQAVGVAALGRPHDPARLVVGHTGQELVIGAVAHLVAADQLEPVQPAGRQLLGDHPGHDLPDRLPADPHQLGHLRLVHLLCQPGGEIVKVAGVARTGAGPFDVLGQIAAAWAVQPSEPALDLAAHTADIQVPPTLHAMVLDLQAAGSAARADRPFAAQRDRDDHRLLAKLHVPDPRARQPEHPVICRRDSHAALLHRPLELNSQQPAEHGAAAGRPRRAQLARPSRSPERERRSGAARRASSGSHRFQGRFRETVRLQGIRPLDPGFGPATWQRSPGTARHPSSQRPDRASTHELTPK